MNLVDLDQRNLHRRELDYLFSFGWRVNMLELLLLKVMLLPTVKLPSQVGCSIGFSVFLARCEGCHLGFRCKQDLVNAFADDSVQLQIRVRVLTLVDLEQQLSVFLSQIRKATPGLNFDVDFADPLLVAGVD